MDVSELLEDVAAGGGGGGGQGAGIAGATVTWNPQGQFSIEIINDENVTIEEDIKQLAEAVDETGSYHGSEYGESEYSTDNDDDDDDDRSDDDEESQKSHRQTVMRTLSEMSETLRATGGAGTSSWNQGARSVESSPYQHFDHYSAGTPHDEGSHPPPVCLDNCLALNRAYQAVIQESIEKLVELLAQNALAQEETKAEIDRLSKVSRSSATSSMCGGKHKGLLQFGAPYFKDVNGFPAPPNIDTLQKRRNGELDVFTRLPRQWIKRERALLTESVLANLRKQQLRPIMEKREFLLEKKQMLEKGVRDSRQMNIKSEDDILLKLELDERSLRDVNRRLEECEESFVASQRILDKELCMDDQLLTRVDWMLISSSIFDNERTPEECRLQWTYCMQPRVNRSRWIKGETKRLKELVHEANGVYDWEVIAGKLGTNRNAFQCCQRYQTEVNAHRSKGPWTREEDMKLLEVIVNCRIKDFIPWRKVTFYMPGRTKPQIYNRWHFTLNPRIKKGSFTPAEDAILMKLVEKFGPDFRVIASIMKTRCPPQLHFRYRSLTDNVVRGAWTKDEDRTILRHVKTHGTEKWALVAGELQNRNRFQVRQRYMALEKHLRLARIRKLQRQQRHLSDPSYIYEETDDDAERIIADCPTRKSYREVGQTKINRISASTTSLQKLMERHEKRLAQMMTDAQVAAGGDLDGLNRNIHSLSTMIKKSSWKSITKRTKKKKADDARAAEELEAKTSPADRKLIDFFRSSFVVPQKKVAAEVDQKWVDSMLNFIEADKLTLPEAVEQRRAVIREKLELGGPIRVNEKPAEQAANGPDVVVLNGDGGDHLGENGEGSMSSASVVFPPTLHTVAGLRSLLLERKRLNTIVNANNQHLVDEPPPEHIWSPNDLLPETTEEITPPVADHLLNKRFARLFFWPSLMASTHPHESANFGKAEPRTRNLQHPYIQGLNDVLSLTQRTEKGGVASTDTSIDVSSDRDEESVDDPLAVGRVGGAGAARGGKGGVTTSRKRKAPTHSDDDEEEVEMDIEYDIERQAWKVQSANKKPKTATPTSKRPKTATPTSKRKVGKSARER